MLYEFFKTTFFITCILQPTHIFLTCYALISQTFLFQADITPDPILILFDTWVTFFWVTMGNYLI